MFLHVTDVHAGFVHVLRERAAAGQTPQAAPDSQVRAKTGCIFSFSSHDLDLFRLRCVVTDLMSLWVQVGGERAGG